MTIYEFYMTYILTGKALLVSTNLQPLRTYLNASTVCIEYRTSANSGPFEIPHDIPINHLIRYGIKITLVTDPVYISASILTGVISIPLPIPYDLPF